jgi:phosphatidylinositol alpha-1,6-mannosyltransferase
MAGNGGRCLLVANTFPPVIGGSSNVYENLARRAAGEIVVLTSRLDHRTGKPLAGCAAHDAAASYPIHRIDLVRPPLTRISIELETGILASGRPPPPRPSPARGKGEDAVRHPEPSPLAGEGWVGGPGAMPLYTQTQPALAGAAAGSRWRRLATEARIGIDLLRTVAALVRKYRIGVVCIADDETVGWLVPAAKRLLRRAAIVYCHGDDLVETDPRRIQRRRRWFDAADAVVAASGFARDRLAGPYGVPPSRIETILNGVDLDRFRPLPPPPDLAARYGVGGGRGRVLLAASRLVPRKGVDRTLQALPSVLAAHPDTVLLIVGDGEQRAALEWLAADLGVAHALRFAGAVPPEAMPAHYALADILVLPNRAAPEGGGEDGMPLVFLEANACGKPAVGGRAGGTTEAIADGENGLLVDGDDPAAIAGALLRLLGDAALYERLRAGALAAARRADWSERTAAFLALCQRLGTRS